MIHASRLLAAAAATIAMSTGMPAFAQQAVGFSKVFAPDTIGPGSVSTLRFAITNNTSSPVTDLNFTDNLPSGVTVADPSGAFHNCGDGTVSANAGGSAISLAGGRVGGNQSCVVRVNVTSSAPGTYTNVSGDLTSSAGNSGTATDDLTVATDRPGFSKVFAPDSVDLGERSTLTFTIDNTANNAAVSGLNFTDNLPAGMAIAVPANRSSTCTGGLLNANAGGTVISYASLFPGDAAVAAGASCTLSVDVVSTGGGVLENLSGDLTSFAVNASLNSGKATAALAVNVGKLHLIKSFIGDPTPTGGTVTMEFTILNRDRLATASNIAFDDDLGAVLAGLSTIGLPAADVCGAGSLLDGTDFLSFTNGELAPEASCTFSVEVQVPADATPGGYANTTSAITGELDGSPFTGNQATEILFIENAPALNKTFAANPVGAGDTLTMEFTVTNTDPDSAATDIRFEDNLDAFIVGLSPTGLPADDVCGTGSTLTSIIVVSDTVLALTDGNLPAGGECTFSVAAIVPVGAPIGTATNTTSEITATVLDATRTGSPASATLTVVTAPELVKEFLDDPVPPGGTVDLEFTLEHPAEAEFDATGIAFSDDLAAVGIAGLEATGLPLNDVCGAGSQVSGTSTIVFNGGTLAAGESCSFTVTLAVPADALPGVYTNETSDVTATVAGVSASNNGTTDELIVSGLEFTKAFTDDPVIPGAVVTLEFTISNSTASLDVKDITFSDDLDDALPGMVGLDPLPADPCGAGSVLELSAGGQLLTLTGGALAAGTSCTFSISAQVPAAAVSDIYQNVTSLLQAAIGDTTIQVGAAVDELVVSDELLLFSKSFSQAVAGAGQSLSLEFTIVNQSATETVSGIAFNDDLDAALTGLVASGLPVSDVCGAGSNLAGTDVIMLSGGELGPGASCTFAVTVNVPGDAEPGAVASNVTSEVSGLVGQQAVFGEPATAEFAVDAIEFSKAFDPAEVEQGGTTLLSFTISNFGPVTVDRLLFTDNLEAALPGLTPGGLPLADVCGAGSSLTYTTILTFAGGILGPDESCTFAVPVTVPGDAAFGSYLNVTSALTTAGPVFLVPPASATLTVVEVAEPEKALVCHKPGTPAERTLEIDVDSVPDHLAHGDYLGECEPPPEPPQPEDATICHQPGTPAEQTLTVPATAVPGHLNHGDYEGECEAPLDPPEPEDATVCHQPGTSAEQTLTVPAAALPGHLSHGDYEGECEAPAEPPASEEVTLCHNPGHRSQRTLVLPPGAAEDHLAHGDALGACEE